MINTYGKMLPVYMKEDEKFSAVYKYLESIFNQTAKTCEDIRADMKFSRNSEVFLKVLNLFGQQHIYKERALEVVGLWLENNELWHVDVSEDLEQLDINLSEFSFYYYAKFNTIKNNFDGTFIDLKKSFEELFNKRDDYISLRCSQDIVEVDSKKYPRVLVEVELSNSLVSLFPPVTAYPVGHEYDIRYIDMSWVNSSEDNFKLYSFYKDFLELITLLQNNYFKLDILGVISLFEIDTNAPILRWGDSRWNNSLWSDVSVQEEE